VTPLLSHRVIGPAVVLIFSICVANLLAGCSGIKPYPNGLDKNLSVHTVTDSGDWFSRVRAAVDIHRVGDDCTLSYEGTVPLGDPVIKVGIPPHRWSYLVFVFDTSSFLGNRSGTITYETLMKPLPAFRYEAAATYKNDIYNVTIREFPSDRSKSRELDRVALRACRSAFHQPKK
jgi:hypothetical protein